MRRFAWPSRPVGPTKLGLLGLFVLGIAWLARSFLMAGTQPDAWEDEPFQAPAIDAKRLQAIQEAGRLVRPLHRRKTPPRPGDWLDKYKEAGQSFAAYREERPNHPTASRTTIYVLPMGDFQAKQMPILDATTEALAIFYGVPVKRLKQVGWDDLPPSARRSREGRPDQLRTPFLLDRLRKHRPADAVAVLGLSSVDLTPGDDWNYVFGQASLSDRVGVWSMARFGDPEKEHGLVLRRTLQTALHETGHMLGIRHCTAFECCMNGSNHLEEADGRPLAFCPECEMKVWWACGVAPKARYRELAEFAEKHGLKDAKDWRAAERALGKAL